MIEPSADVAPSAQVASSARVWHLAQVREDALIGEETIVGRGAYIGEGVVVGPRCKIQNYALVYEPASLAEGVFVGPAAVFTNDHCPRAINADGTLKSASDWEAVGVTVERGAAIGARAVCVAPVRIGAWASVGAGAVVTRDVAPYALVVGVPAAVLSFVLFATSSGLPDLDVVDAFINNIGVVASAIIMCVVVAWVLRRTRLLQNHLNAVSESRMVGPWWRVLVGVVVPVLLGYMFIQTLWTYLSEGYESEAYSSGFVMVFGWGMLLVVALGTAVMSLIPWRTPVDEFEALTLEAASQEED